MQMQQQQQVGGLTDILLVLGGLTDIMQALGGLTHFPRCRLGSFLGSTQACLASTQAWLASIQAPR